MRNSSSMRGEVEELDAAQPIGELDRRQRLEPQRAPPLGRHPACRQRPRRRLEHVPVARIAMRERVLEVVGERPHLPLLDEVNGRRRDHLVVVVHELRERVVHVARRAS